MDRGSRDAGAGMTPEMVAWLMGGGTWQLPLQMIATGPERRRGASECPVCHEPAMIPATRNGGKPYRCRQTPRCVGMLTCGPIENAPPKPRKRKTKDVPTNGKV